MRQVFDSRWTNFSGYHTISLSPVQTLNFPIHDTAERYIQNVQRTRKSFVRSPKKEKEGHRGLDKI